MSRTRLDLVFGSRGITARIPGGLTGFCSYWERLPEMLPAAVYVTLSPFVGAEEAYAPSTMRR